jgi:hypothetical protein
MRYGTTTRGTNFPAREPWQVGVLRVLLFFVPRANPHNEPLYPQVKRWALELDDKQKAVREVGIGEGDTPLFRAPDGSNFGFWTDSEEPVPDDYMAPLSAEEFENLWRKAPNHEV